MNTDTPHMLEQLQINRIQGSLKRLGWQLLTSTELFQIWQAGDASSELLLPLDPEKSDFRGLLAQAVDVLARDKAVAREPWFLYESVLAARMDTTSWKRETNLQTGLIGWSDGEELISAARSSLLAAAKSSRESKLVHGRSGHFIAKAFLDSCIMGQTGAGSFIIRAHTPADEMFHLSAASQRSNPLDIGSLERISGAAIVETLGRGISTVRRGLDEFKRRPQLEIFTEMSNDGVSYELLKSLTDLCRDGDSKIEIIREFSGGSSETTHGVSFKATDSATLEKASRKLLAQSDPVEVRIIGEVTNLTYESSDPHRVVRVKTQVAGSSRKVRVRMSREQYDLAIDAHRQGKHVSLSGILEKENNLFWLYGAQFLGMVDPPQAALFDSPTLF